MNGTFEVEKNKMPDIAAAVHPPRANVGLMR